MITELKIMKTEFETNKTNQNNLEFELNEFQNANDRLKKANKIIENNCKRKEDILNKMNKEKSDLKLILCEMQQRIAEFDRRLLVINKDRNNIREMYDKCLIEMDNKNEIISNLNINLNDLKNEYINLENTLKNIQKKHKELQLLYENKSNVNRESCNKINQFAAIQNKLNETLKNEINEKPILRDNIGFISKERDNIINKYHELIIKYNNLNNEIIPNLNP